VAPNIPLVKCKSGNLSDVNNYRAVALPNSVSKILETLFDFIETNNAVDNYQLAVGKIILLPYAHKLFLENSRLLQTAWKSCFSFFIDFSKAFDSVDYWLLSSKLIDSIDCI